jgi:membrane protein
MKLFIKRIGKVWWDASSSTYAAALAYYAVFSLAPLLIIFIILLGAFVSPHIITTKFIALMSVFAGREIASTITTLVAYTYQPELSTIAFAVSTIIALFAAYAFVAQIIRAFDEIWNAGMRVNPSISLKKTGSIALLLVLIFGVVLIASFTGSTFVAYTLRVTEQTSKVSAFIVSAVSIWNSIIVPVTIFIFFTLLYAFVPPKKIRLLSAVTGGIVGGTSFIFGRFLLGLFVAEHSVMSVYGAAGAFVLVLVWFYYSAHILLLGAATALVVDSKRSLHQ